MDYEDAFRKLMETAYCHDEDMERFERCYIRALHWTGVCVENEGIKRGIEKDLAIMQEMYIKEHKGDEKYAGWIKTSERLPELHIPVIIYNPEKAEEDEQLTLGRCYKEYKSPAYYWTRARGLPVATEVYPYWMPLPEPPEVEE